MTEEEREQQKQETIKRQERAFRNYDKMLQAKKTKAQHTTTQAQIKYTQTRRTIEDVSDERDLKSSLNWLI